MALRDDPRVKTLLAGFLLSLFALVAITAFGLLAFVSALVDPTATAPLVLVLLEAVLPYVVAATLVGGVSVLLLVWLSVAAVRRASLPRDDRLARLARRVERHSPGARAVDLSGRVEPTTEDRIEALKRRYVEGELTELEYERRLADLLDDETLDDDVSDERIRQHRTDYEFE